MPFYLMWYYKVYDKLSGNSFKQLEKNVIQLETQENLQNMLQGIGVCTAVFQRATYILYSCQKGDCFGHFVLYVQHIALKLLHSHSITVIVTIICLSIL